MLKFAIYGNGGINNLKLSNHGYLSTHNVLIVAALRSSASQNGNEDNRLSNYIRNLAEDLQLEERVEQDLYRDATRDASEPVEDEKLSESLRGINQIVTETTKA